MDRRIVILCVTAGSTIGGYLPTLAGFGTFSMVSFLGGIVGGLAGVWPRRGSTRRSSGG